MAEEEFQYDNPDGLKMREQPHRLTTTYYKKSSAPYEAKAINLGADFMTTRLTTFVTKKLSAIRVFGTLQFLFMQNDGGSLLLRTAVLRFLVGFYSFTATRYLIPLSVKKLH